MPAAIQRLLWCLLVLTISSAMAEPAESAGTNQPVAALRPGFRVLVLAESGGHHMAFTQAARPWLSKLGEQNGFELDYLSDTGPITPVFLARYQLVLQLDFVPYGWKPEAMEAFKDYIEQGKGGWVGLHHASLLGDFAAFTTILRNAVLWAAQTNSPPK